MMHEWVKDSRHGPIKNWEYVKAAGSSSLNHQTVPMTCANRLSSYSNRSLRCRLIGPPMYVVYRLFFPLLCIVCMAALKSKMMYNNDASDGSTGGTASASESIRDSVRVLLSLTSFIVGLLLSNRIRRVRKAEHECQERSPIQSWRIVISYC